MKDQYLERIEKAFNALSKEDCKDFLKSIQELASKTGASAEKATILLFTLIVVFVLIHQNQVADFSILGFKIEKKDAILILLPIVISYIYFDMIVNIAKTDLLSKTHQVVLRRLHPPVYQEDLSDYFLYTPSLFENKYYKGWLPLSVWFLFFCVVVFSPVVFEGYALFILYQLYRFDFPFVLSFVCTSIFSLQGLLTLVYFFSGVYGNYQ